MDSNIALLHAPILGIIWRARECIDKILLGFRSRGVFQGWGVDINDQPDPMDPALSFILCPVFYIGLAWQDTLIEQSPNYSNKMFNGIIKSG